MYRRAIVLASVSFCNLLAGCSGEDTPTSSIILNCTEPNDLVINCNNGDENGDSDDDVVIGAGNTDGNGTATQSENKCAEKEAKCTTADGYPGWCMDKYGPVNPDAGLVCLACDDRYVLVPKLDLCPPGCAIPGGVYSAEQCQGPVGSGGCPAACCPICY